jgi:hypothetical protein
MSLVFAFYLVGVVTCAGFIVAMSNGVPSDDRFSRAGVIVWSVAWPVVLVALLALAAVGFLIAATNARRAR